MFRRRHHRTRAWPSVIRLAVPERAVLLVKGYERATDTGAGGPTGGDQEHHRQQPDHLGLVRHELRHRPPQADRLGAQVLPYEQITGGRGVALVEDEVDTAAPHRSRSGSSALLGTR